MAEHETEQLVRRYLDAWCEHDRATLEELLSDDVVVHGPGLRSTLRGRDAVVAVLVDPTFALLEVVVHDLVVQGPRAAVRYEVIMRQAVAVLDVEPSGEELREHGSQFVAVRDGRIAELWGQNDQVGFLAQLGVRVVPDVMLAGPS